MFNTAPIPKPHSQQKPAFDRVSRPLPALRTDTADIAGEVIAAFRTQALLASPGAADRATDGRENRAHNQ